MSEDRELDYIPVTWIKEYHFCPRIIYFMGVLGAHERVTESIKAGGSHHTLESLRENRRLTLAGDRKTRVDRRWLKLKVSSRRLGVRGVIDEVAEVNGELTIVETKYMKKPKKPRRRHLYQATAYAMLAEERLKKPVRRILLRYLPEGGSHTVTVTDRMRRHVEWTVRRIRKIVCEEKLPRVRSDGRCRGCGWLWVCRKT